MPQEDQRAAELDHAEEVGSVAFPARGESAEVLQPGEESFDLPAAHVAAKGSAVLSSPSFASVGSNHLDAMQLAKPRVQGVAIVGFVADQSLRDGGDMSLRERVFDQRGLIR
jgi:hypothetical protein